MKRAVAFAVSVLCVFLLASYSIAAQEKEAGAPYPDDILYSGTGQAVVFSHKAHVEDYGSACGDCHPKLFEVKQGAAKEAGDFTMKALAEGKYCGGCHNGDAAFSSEDFEKCQNCHAGPEAIKVKTGRKVAGPAKPITLGTGESAAVFKNEAHAALECAACHFKLFPMKLTKTITTMDEINAGRSCGKCHDGKTTFDATQCGMCHPKM